MATVESYQVPRKGKDKDGNPITLKPVIRYQVRYRTPERKTTRKRGFKTKRDAQEFANTVETQKLSGTYISPKAGRVTVGELGTAWFARHKTHRSYESAWRVHVEPRWSDVTIADLKATEVQAWMTLLMTDPPTGRKRGVGVKAQVVETCLTVLLGICDDAVTDRLIPVNPLRDRIKYPDRDTVPHRYLTHEQVAAFANEGTRGEIVLLLAYTGIRWGEMANLRVRHVDFLRRRISLEWVKGHRGRVVSMPKFVADALARVCEGKGRDDLLWPNANGRPMAPPSSHDSWWSGAVARCMAADPTFPRVTPHDLRHTYASLAVSSGANVKVVQRQLGHKSAAMTLDTYSDLFTPDLDAVAKAFDEKCVQIVSTRAKNSL